MVRGHTSHQLLATRHPLLLLLLAPYLVLIIHRSRSWAELSWAERTGARPYLARCCRSTLGVLSSVGTRPLSSRGQHREQ